MGGVAAGMVLAATLVARGVESGGRWSAVAAQVATGPGAVFLLSLTLIFVLPLMRERGDLPG
jgi:hypothetical protein